MSSSSQRDGTLKHPLVLLLVATLCACDGKKPKQSTSVAEKTPKPSVATLIARQNLRQILAGTAFGNFMKAKSISPR